MKKVVLVLIVIGICLTVVPDLKKAMKEGVKNQKDLKNWVEKKDG